MLRLPVLLVFLVAAGAMAGRIPRQNWGPGQGPPRDVFNNFGPNWGAGQPWGQPPQKPQPPQNSFDYPDDQNEAEVVDPGEDDAGDEENTADDDDDTPTSGQTFHNPPSGCRCVSLQHFNPVCGSDGNTYKNSNLLKCFQQCGQSVTQRRMGSC